MTLADLFSVKNAPKVLIAIAALFVPIVTVGTFAADQPLFGAPAAAIAGLVLMIAGLSLADSLRNHAIAVGLMLQPIALTAGLSSHPWQIDAHMAFFALLATLVALNDVRALFTATIFVAAHHFSLAVVLPALVYPDGTGLEALLRTALHGVLVILETVVLLSVVHVRQQNAHEIAQQLKAAQAAEQTQRELGEKTAQALKDAEAQREAARRTAQDAEDARASAQQEQTRASELSERMLQDQKERAAADAKQREGLTNVIEEVSKGLSALSAGRLNYRITTRFEGAYDRLRTDFNQTADSLAQAFSDMARLSNDVLSQTSELNQSATSLATRTEQQAATLEKASMDIKQVADMVGQSSGVADSAADASVSASSQTDVTADILGKAAAAIERIEASSNEISRITDMIDGISFQTNLLALNAGVEAARAGDAGRGFAVVASEVRTLAQRSSEAASDITKLIESSVNEVKEGVTFATHSVSALEEVSAAIKKSTEWSKAIASNTSDQTALIREIADSVSSLDSVTQRNAAMFEETSAACAVLVGSAEKMQGLVSQFTTQPASAGENTGDPAAPGRQLSA
ncbi:MAG: methyl-accepting chemotaxis protein [Pseudomonadota bacterium]